MYLFVIALLLYAGSLLFIQPAPESLKSPKLNFRENFLAIRCSLFLGVLLIFVFLATSEFKFLKISDSALMILGLSNLKALSLLWPLQFFTHLFIHLDLTHLFGNLVALALTSLYERRVGPRRFLAVLSVSALSSGFSILFFSDAAISGGISGGIFGLAAAYFIDFDNVRGKDFVMTLVTVTILFLLFSFTGTTKSEASLKVDHVAHILGAISGVVYCRLFRRHATPDPV